MATTAELMGVGTPAAVANALGQNLTSAAVGAGSVQTDATLLTTAVTKFATVNSGGGARLPPATGQPIYAVYNGGSNALLVYAAVGETINAVATASGFSVTNGKSAVFTPSGNTWIGTLSA
jgi:hypothetical protein